MRTSDPAQSAREVSKRKSLDFWNADDGGGDLCFEEFIQTLPLHIVRTHTRQQLLEWFEMADLNGDQRVTREEFFMWSLKSAAVRSGSGIARIFQKFDVDHSGKLDQVEFGCACDDLGFGDIADTLFEQIPKSDADDSLVEYTSIVTTVTQRLERGSKPPRVMQDFITAMALDDDQSHPEEWDTHGWSFSGQDVEQARRELGKLLSRYGANFAGLVNAFCVSKDDSVAFCEFRDIIEKRLGFKGPEYVIYEMFDAVDTQQAGRIRTYDVNAWAHRRVAKSDVKNQTVLTKVVLDNLLSGLKQNVGLDAALGAEEDADPREQATRGAMEQPRKQQPQVSRGAQGGQHGRANRHRGTAAYPSSKPHTAGSGSDNQSGTGGASSSPMDDALAQPPPIPPRPPIIYRDRWYGRKFHCTNPDLNTRIPFVFEHKHVAWMEVALRWRREQERNGNLLPPYTASQRRHAPVLPAGSAHRNVRASDHHRPSSARAHARSSQSSRSLPPSRPQSARESWRQPPPSPVLYSPAGRPPSAL